MPLAPSLHLLDDRLELRAHGGERHAGDSHLPVRSLADHDVEAGESLVLRRVVVAKLGAPTLPALQGSPGDGLRDDEKAGEVESEMPAGVVLAVAGDVDPPRPLAQMAEAVQSALHLRPGADDVAEILHHGLQLVLDLVRIFAADAVEGLAQ